MFSFSDFLHIANFHQVIFSSSHVFCSLSKDQIYLIRLSPKAKLNIILKSLHYILPFIRNKIFACTSNLKKRKKKQLQEMISYFRFFIAMAYSFSPVEPYPKILFEVMEKVSSAPKHFNTIFSFINLH